MLAASDLSTRRPPVRRDPNQVTKRHAFLVVPLFAVFVIIIAGLLRYLVGPSFAFIWNATGWDVSLSFLPYSVNDPYWWAFVVGLANTVVAGAISIVGATLIGFVIGAIPLAQNAMLSAFARLYVDVFRNVPLILQAIFWYGIILHLPPIRNSLNLLNSVFISSRGVFIPGFADMHLVLLFLILVVAVGTGAILLRSTRGGKASWLSRATAIAIFVFAAVELFLIGPRLPFAFQIEWPKLAGLNFKGGIALTPEFAALVVAVTIYRGAFMAEIFRGGFVSTSQGQIDAAESLGLRPLQTLWTVRLPIALIHILPPLSNEFINIIKVTAIGIIIGFPDLFWISSNSTMQTGRPLQVITVMVLLYLALNFVIAAIMNFFNRRVRARGFM